MNSLAAYVHVPFCRKKCRYCDFFSVPADDAARAAFGAALAGEIRRSPAAGAELTSVYFGGGTPSLLPPEAFRAVFSALRDTFSLSPGCEITVECNPDSVSESLLACLADCGVNRISLGLQTFSPRLLSYLGRVHSAEEGMAAYTRIRQAGFRNVSLDLMTALPGMTADDCRRDLERTIALAPEHVSVYLLKIEPRTPLGQSGEKEAAEEVQEECYLLADRRLTEAGYEHYEISNFAKPGYRSLHNSRYWSGQEYLAFGPGASGYYNGERYRNAADLHAYLVSGGRPLHLSEGRTDARERRRETILLSLRTRDGLSEEGLNADTKHFFRTLQAAGLADRGEGRVFLTPRGFLVSNAIIQQVLESERY